MNIYPIFDLPIEYIEGSSLRTYNYTLVTKDRVLRGQNSMRSYAYEGDVLIGSSRSKCWTRIPGSWAKHEFSDLPPEYKAWIVLLG